MRTSEKYGCRAIAGILSGHGVDRAVLCPGSRNLPLVISFTREKEFKCSTAIDERSAAFVALGQSLVSGNAVALVCTSGTAMLNMTPAIAEAYYRGVPLIVISADRPERWINQADSQTIKQAGTLSNIVKRSYNIVAEANSEDEKWYVDRCINDAIITALSGKRGPVHINIEIDEPLNGEAEMEEDYRIIHRAYTKMSLTDVERHKYAKRLLGSKKILLLSGTMSPNDRLNRVIDVLSKNGNIAVVAEPQANISSGISNIDGTLCVLGKIGREKMRPDLLITIGGAIVSGLMKKWLRKQSCVEHWHIGEGDDTIDTYKHLTDRIDMPPADFFEEIICEINKGKAGSVTESAYSEQWQKSSDRAYELFEQMKESLGWCDVTAIDEVVKKLPKEANVQLSNGMTVRYYEWICRNRAHQTDCNRGVSGIDGSTSTAIGASSVYDGITVLFTGDMSAQYDIGALASIRQITQSEKFKMVVMANGGGNIFKYIKSTRESDVTDKYMYNTVDTDWCSVGRAYGMAVYEASDMSSLKSECQKWIEESKHSAMLVLHTDAKKNAEAMTALVKGKY